jgi:hypothetical protein
VAPGSQAASDGGDGLGGSAAPPPDSLNHDDGSTIGPPVSGALGATTPPTTTRGLLSPAAFDLARCACGSSRVFSSENESGDALGGVGAGVRSRRGGAGAGVISRLGGALAEGLSVSGLSGGSFGGALALGDALVTAPLLHKSSASQPVQRTT